MLKLGCVVAIATCLNGAYEWWAGRVEKMKCKSSRTGKLIETSVPTDFDAACADKVQVACTWYKKQRRSYVFTYDGPVDDAFYSLENALGVLDLELPDAQGRYMLRDLAQGPQLDAALKLTVKPDGKKRTAGEELVAREAQREREQPVWDVAAPAAKKARKAPTVRVPS